jgi:hypothetical protein
VAFGIAVVSSGSLPARFRLAAAAALAGAVALLPVAAAPAATSTTLYGGFDADGNISLTFADGSPIGTPAPPGTLIPAGTYTIEINNNGPDDLGNPHEFELTGPGVSLMAGQTVQVTWTATFAPASTYVYEDELNPTTQHEVFGTAGSGATSTTPPEPVSTPPTTTTVPSSSATPTDNSPLGTGLKAVPFRGVLSGTVSAAGKLALTYKGRGVASLTAGRYTISVTDKSAKSGFVLQEIHESAITITGAALVGTRTLSLDLTAGQWFFYPSFVGTKTYFIVVA